MSNLKEVAQLIEDNQTSLWLDDISCTVECVVLQQAEKGLPEDGEVKDIPYNGWSEKLEELTEAFGHLTPSAFNTIKTLMATRYEDLTYFEQSIVSFDEFEEMRKAIS